MFEQNSYAGDIEVLEAWQLLSKDDDAVLIDVRTHAEWSYVGVPIFDDPGREVVLVEWLSYPSMQVHGNFVETMLAALRDRNTKSDAGLYFLCRSGVRSRHAAIAMTDHWQGPCYNIASGFEGDLDQSLQRSSFNGWKYAGLPWKQF